MDTNNRYSVLLVDDEEDVIQIIVKKLDWEAMGLKIIGHAANGVEALELAGRDRGGGLDLAMVTDGLRAEREQGITIDVAHRYFETARRAFIIADTPGHAQYTRNMVTGASTADLAIVLVDARNGLTEQSRRHAVLSGLLRVPELVLAVNKMDLVHHDQRVFAEIAAEFARFAAELDFGAVTAVPISA